MARTTQRMTALLASGTLAAGMGLAGAPLASADGPDTSAQVLAANEDAQWPEYRQNTMGWNLSVAKFSLWEIGYYEPSATLDDRFGEKEVEALMDYQQATDLKVTGVLDARSWEFLSEDVGVLSQGDTGPAVSAVQVALHEKHGYDLSGDGYQRFAPEAGTFGQATHDAVVAFQEDAGIDADGEVGPITYKALVVTQGND
ncbi:peptidoglycan-binding domain-containing protein [Nocardiopsis ansamitocini]|uniref:Peptidoglycan binding-like domain-containing protein n=1 Tax=Nocardiopsis ansamitocini TaxID=1670832 RepID=A0A9W6PA56_9ACTN|nr:peptidoglycan-binding protein [Nocardiopsis ansamitocini]GLU50470.1 hypothetical protein Nans01_48210 [Nocardiopsis ansamitocini]